MIVAAVQMSSSANIQENLQQVGKKLNLAAESGCRLVLLPENVLCHGSNDQIQKIAKTEEEWEQFLASFSIKNDFNIVWGGIPVKSANQLFNMSLVINNTGKLIAKYAKMHLFECRGIATESNLYQAGSEKTTFNLDDWKISLSICFDIRFPEHFQKADLILCSAAFSQRTGNDHWELLCRARAVENQCYLIAANQYTIGQNPFPTFGHSMIVDPWGTVLQKIKKCSGVITSEINKKRIQQVRNDMPLRKG